MTMVDVKRSLPIIIENYKENNLNELNFTQSDVHQNFRPNIYLEEGDSIYPQWYSDEYEINLNKALEYTSEGTSNDDTEETRSESLSCDSYQFSSPEPPLVKEQDSNVQQGSTEDSRSDAQKYRASLWKTSLEHCSRIVMSSRRKSLEGSFLLSDVDTSACDNRASVLTRRNSVGYFLNRSDNSPLTQKWVQNYQLNRSLGVINDYKHVSTISAMNSSFSESILSTSPSESTPVPCSEDLSNNGPTESFEDGSFDSCNLEIHDSVFSNSTSPKHIPACGESPRVRRTGKMAIEDILDVPVRMRGERLSSSESRKLSISDEFFVEKMLFGLNIPTRNNPEGKPVLNRLDPDRVLSPCSSKYSTPSRSRSLLSVAESENDDSLNSSSSELTIQSTKPPQTCADSLSESCKKLNRDFSTYLSPLSPVCSTPLSESPSTSGIHTALAGLTGEQHSRSKDVNMPEKKTEMNTVTEPQTDLELLQAAATRLRLSIRRPSILAWRQRFVDNNYPMTSTDSFVSLLDQNVKKQECLETRRAKISEDLDWIRQELGNMKNLDESLAGQFLSIREEIHRLKLQWSCEEHEELLEDVIDEMKERDELSEFLDTPIDLIECNPLKHLGVTRMNITNRRFSMC